MLLLEWASPAYTASKCCILGRRRIWGSTELRTLERCSGGIFTGFAGLCIWPTAPSPGTPKLDDGLRREGTGSLCAVAMQVAKETTGPQESGLPASGHAQSVWQGSGPTSSPGAPAPPDKLGAPVLSFPVTLANDECDGSSLQSFYDPKS